MTAEEEKEAFHIMGCVLENSTNYYEYKLACALKEKIEELRAANEFILQQTQTLKDRNYEYYDLVKKMKKAVDGMKRAEALDCPAGSEEYCDNAEHDVAFDILRATLQDIGEAVPE